MAEEKAMYGTGIPIMSSPGNRLGQGLVQEKRGREEPAGHAPA